MSPLTSLEVYSHRRYDIIPYFRWNQVGNIVTESLTLAFEIDMFEEFHTVDSIEWSLLSTRTGGTEEKHWNAALLSPADAGLRRSEIGILGGASASSREARLVKAFFPQRRRRPANPQYSAIDRGSGPAASWATAASPSLARERADR